MIDVAIALEDAQADRRVRDLLAAAPGTMPANSSIVDLGSQPGRILDWLQAYFLEDGNRRLVLISDVLLRPEAPPSRCNLVKRCQAKVGQYAFGTIAITARAQRIADIDRTIRPDASRDDFRRAFDLTVSRVEYLAAPSKPFHASAGSIVVRPLRSTNEMEFRSYFTLRHRVYTIMGYLDEEMERCRSGLEMNEADLHAIHIGAFYRTGPQERLIGTARVVTNDEANVELQQLFEGLVRRDPVVRQRLDSPYPLTLPIFQSYEKMTAIMSEIYSHRQRCGEISRVIVDQEFRGTGISRALMKEVLQRSINAGVERLFLECLKIHEPLYSSYGFRPIAEGPVVDVYRTMVAMELQCGAAMKAAATQSSGEDQRFIA